MKAVKSYLTDRRSLYGVVSVIIGLMFLTFYLYDFPLLVFTDALLFSGAFLLGWSSWDFYRWFKGYQQLQRLAEQGLLTSNALLLPIADSKKEALLQKMLEKEVQQRFDQQLAEQHLRRELGDDFSLWLHQIKTPVAALDLLLQTSSPDTQQLQTQLFKISEYLDMMLNYVRANVDLQDLVIQKTALAPVVKETVKKYASFFAAKNLTLTLGNLSETVVTDPKWLCFILDQLLSNSIKYTDNGGITLTIEDVQLVVKDNGVGILPADLPLIFEKGYTGFNGRTQQRASGLGLYLSRQMGERLGITITATSTPGDGTKMMLKFPDPVA